MEYYLNPNRLFKISYKLLKLNPIFNETLLKYDDNFSQNLFDFFMLMIFLILKLRKTKISNSLKFIQLVLNRSFYFSSSLYRKFMSLLVFQGFKIQFYCFRLYC